MGTLYLGSCNKTNSSGSKFVSVESLVVLHAIKCLQNGDVGIDVVFVDSHFEPNEPSLPVDVEFVNHRVVGKNY